MRKALIGVLLVATAATPLWAAPGERVRTARQDGDDSAPPARVQRQEARQEQRIERQQVRQEQRIERQQQRIERQQAPQPQVQQPQQQAQQGWRNRGDGQGWQGRRGGDGGVAQSQQGWRGRGNADREAFRRHIEDTRAASARSAQDGSPELQRKAAENQARYERRLREERRDRREDRWDRREDRRDWREDRRDWREDRRDHRRWNRDWRRDSRYDWQRYRYVNRDIFRRGRYYAPFRHHRYNRLSIGFILGSAFLGHNYWINDPWHYRLPPAYPGTRWVRYYDDVLLVDIYTGEVIDVIYDFFW